MPEFVESITLGEVTVLLAFAAVLAGVLRKAIPALRRWSRIVDAVLGVPESRPGAADARPGVLQRLETVERRLGTLDTVDRRLGTVEGLARSAAVSARSTQRDASRAAAELQPNGGASARDAIDGIRAQLDDIARRLPPPPSPEEQT